MNMRNLITVIVGSYLFFLPWDGYFLITQNFMLSPSFIFLALVVAIYIISFLIGIENKIIFPNFLWPLVTILLYAVISLIWTPQTIMGISRAIFIISYLGTVILIYTIITRLDVSVFNLLWSFILGVISSGLYAWYMGVFVRGRLTIAEGFNPSWTAAFLVLAIIASIAIYSRSNAIGKLFLVGSIVSMILMLLLTQGRNAIISVSLSFTIAIIAYFASFNWSQICYRFKQINKRLVLQAVVVFFVIVFLTITILTNTELLEGLHRVAMIQYFFTGGDLERATASRVIFWEEYLNIAPSTVLIGGGISSAEYLHGQLYGGATAPHNVYLLVFIEYGLFGLFLWLLFVLGLVRFALSDNARNFYLIWLSIFFILFGIGNDILYYKYWWIGLLLFLMLFIDGKRQVKYYNESKAQKQNIFI